MFKLVLMFLMIALVSVVLSADARADSGDNSALDGIADSAVAESEDLALDYYETALVGKADGAYVHGNDLFLISRCPFEIQSARLMKQAEKKADEGILKRLEEWCFAFRDSFSVEKPSTANRECAWEFLDRLDPNWKIEDWKFSGSSRTIVKEPDFENGKMVVVVVVDRRNAEASARKLIPDTTDENVLRSSRAALQKIGVVEFERAVKENAGDELTLVDDVLKSYIENSAFAQGLRREMEAQGKVTVTTNDEQTLVITTVAIPRMQQLFLSCGKERQEPSKQIQSGVLARGIAYDASVSLDERLNQLKCALCENPGDAELWNLYGRCLSDRGDKMAAVICYRNALMLKPDYEYPIVNLAKVYSELGYKRLGVGLALLARGTAKDKWSISESQKILFDP